MALQSRTITVGADRDSNNGGKNYVSGQVIYIKDEAGVLAPIFRDIDGLDPIAQNTISNVTNAKGQFTFFIEEGNYTAEYNDQSTPLFVFGADYFNNQIDFVTNQILSNTQPYSAGNFTDGFTFTELNQYGNATVNDGGTDYVTTFWYIGDTLPHTVAPLTNPRDFPLLYQQRDFNSAEFVATKTTENTQDFIDSFALKIFQSPTDGLNEINTRTLLGGEVYEVRKVSGNSLAAIYSDKEGLNPITQDGTSNVSGSDGVVEFYVADGDYYIEVNGESSQFSVKKSYSFASFGAVNEEDSTDAILSALTAAKDGNIAIVDYSGNTYSYTGDISVLATDLKMHTNVTLKGNGGYIHIFNTFEEIGNITSSQSEGNNSLELSSVTGIQEGNVLVTTVDIPYSFSSHRPDYKEGEFLEVKSVSGNVVTTEFPLEANYDGLVTDKVYKANLVNLELKGGTYKSDGAVYGLRLSNLSKKSVVAPTEVSVINQVVGALSIEKSYKPRVLFGYYNAPYTASNSYGINIVNSQDISVHDVEAFGGRHPITTGGDPTLPNPPCRRIKVYNSILSNSSDASTYAADFHGNSADCSYINCVTTGGVGLAGSNPSYIGGEVIGHDDSNDIPLSYHELVGGVCLFKDVKVRNNTGVATTVCGVTAGSLVNNITSNYRVVVDGLDAEINSNVKSIISAYESSGRPNDWVLNNFSTRGGLALLDQAILFTKVVGGRDATSITVESPEGLLPDEFIWVKNSGTTLPNCTIRLPTINGATTISADYLVSYQGYSESGENANGSWVRYPDGRMEQEHRLSVSSAVDSAFLGGFRTGGIQWVFPLPFAVGESPVVSATPEDGSLFSVVESVKDDTSVTLLGTSVASQPVGTRNISLIAKGKWK